MDGVREMGKNKRFAVMEVSSMTGISKKKRISASSDSSLVELEDPGFFVNSPDTVVSNYNFKNSGSVVPEDGLCSSFCSHQVPGSSCSSSCEYQYGEVVKYNSANKDSETKNCETIIKSTIPEHSKFRERSQTVRLCGDSEKAHSRATKRSSKSHRRTFQGGKIPPRIEIEAFFEEAEKYEQKRFAEKYNFDIVNDEPLEGRYMWLPLKP